MRLLKQYDSIIDAENLAESLENKGIATFISSKDSHQFGRIQTGALFVGVWVVLVDQYMDAEILLKNKKHTPANPLTREQIIEIKSTTKTTGLNTLSKWASTSLAVLLLVLGAIFLVVTRG